MMEIFKNPKFRFLLMIATLVVATEVAGIFSFHFPRFIELAFLLPVIFLVGKDVLKGGIESLFSLRLTNMYFLMTVAIVGAMIIGEFEEAAVIVALFALSEKLEDLGIEHSQEAIESLIKDTPKQVTLKNGTTKSVDEIEAGDIFIVKPGQAIGLDGVILEGISSVDEAAITGEPLPVEKGRGGAVFAGTVNQYGSLTIKVTKKAADSTLQRIVNLTKSALQHKAAYQQFIEKFSNYYTPVVFILALLLAIVPVLLGQEWRMWFERAITLLVIACPCALVVSTPISIFSALANASRRGALVKGGRFLEELGDVKAIAFDKTRTLTFGKPTIEKIFTYQGATEKEVLACAAGMEAHSEHPLAHAVVTYAQEKKLNLHEVTDFKAIVGKGIEANCLICQVDGHILGNLEFLSERKIKISQEIRKEVETAQTSGQTALLLADREGVKGLLIVADEIKPAAKPLIAKLHELGIKSIIVTGDNQVTANQVAKVLGIDDVKGNLLPEDKVTEVKKLKQHYGTVAMVGDGINDAPVLSMANIGIAMGAMGSDVAIESADIALMSDNIEVLPFLIRLGRATKNTIQRNIGLALGTKLIALGLSAVGILSLSLAVFADVGVTVVVILLSLKLMNFESKSDPVST